MTLLILLALGVAIGRLWSRYISSSRLADCPKCALDENEQRARIEINTLRREAEARMAQTAEAEAQCGVAPRHAAPHNQKGEER